ncbi:porin [Rivibacter subsaxonicus]|uniref:Putative porin n=1 Tax=Rivibacter subsaxonicus TaxID=457575 RepID=A0A4Q7W0L7_9BURK|nr:porin [Rivibacter subsaxonicus]RZU02059.1 putative porin [Rivibacter subsaxonicus]
MKKTLIALAALASVSAVSAQSSVTLYGRVEANGTYQKPGSNASVAGGANGEAVYKLNDGSVNGIGGSRWGLRGTEDLGSGLKAYFVLESGFNVDSGSAGDAARTFNRQAYVALGSSSLGDLRLGRQDTLTRTIDVNFIDDTGEGELSVAESVATIAGGTRANRPLFQNFGSRVDNAVTYTSPSFGGFYVTGLVAAGEGTTARQQGGLIGWKSGPFSVAATYEEYTGLGFGAYNKTFTVGGNWNFGLAAIYAGYQDTSDLGTNVGPSLVGGQRYDHEGYSVGLLVPVGAWQFRGQYTASTVSPVSGDLDQSKWGLSARYALSKRTTMYGVFTQRDGDRDDLFVRQQEAAIGIAHVF